MDELTISEFLGQLLVGLILAVLVGAGSLVLTIVGAVWKFWRALRPRIEDGEEKLGEIETTFEKFVEFVQLKLESNDSVHSDLDRKLDRMIDGAAEQDDRLREIATDCSRLGGQCDAFHGSGDGKKGE